MSRIGKKAIAVPAGVEVSVNGQTINVKGPKGQLEYTAEAAVTVSFDADAKAISITANDEARQTSAFQGLARSLVNNMVLGVSTGWKKELEIRGTGYRGTVQGKVLNLNLGYSHPINYDIPEGITITMPNNTSVVVEGADKQLVGQVAADIRFFRQPEPYKGKGVRYVGEYVALKEGKAAGKK